VGTLAGIASDGDGEIVPQTAPFTGRLCLGYHVEILCADAGAGAGQEWRRVYEDSGGTAFIVGRHQRRRGRVNLRFAHVLFPPEPRDGEIAGATIFAGPSGAFDRRTMPAILHALLASTVFSEATRDALYGPGRTLLFNERIVVPGQRIVATGASKRDPAGGARLSFTSAEPVHFAHGTAEAMKARAPRPEPARVWRNAALLAVAIGLPTTAAVLIESGLAKQSAARESRSAVQPPSVEQFDSAGETTGASVYPSGRPLQTVLTGLPSQPHAGTIDWHAVPPNGTAKQVPVAAHPSVSL
jgi:hypothetical protein